MTVTTSSGTSWIELVIGVVAGALAGVGIWYALRATFTQQLFQRTNHRGRQVPVAAGSVLVLATITVTAVWHFADTVTGTVDLGDGSRTMAVLIACGFGLLGLFDDLAAEGDDRGFRGHLSALAKGRLTTGAVKLLGGGLLAIVVAPTSPADDWWRIVLGAAVIALAANTANLFDRAPARCAKVAIVCAIGLFAAASPDVSSLDYSALGGVGVVVGAMLGLVVFDAREQLMLGDAGSNVLGAILGWGLVATTGWLPQAVVLVVLVALNVISEKVSFSRVIASNSVLGAIDRFGRPPVNDT